jgi:hypothetical protein
MKVSFAIAALLGYISAINVQHQIGMEENLSTLASVDAMSEANRYYGVDGKPLLLAETTGHARIKLTQVRKTNGPISIAEAEAVRNHHGSHATIEKDDASEKSCSAKSEGHEFHCPLDNGKPQKVHIK